MPLLRRAAPTDPSVVARLTALGARAPGWVPPAEALFPTVDDPSARAAVTGPVEAGRDEVGAAAVGAAAAGAASGGREASPPVGPGPPALSSALDRWRQGRIDPGRRGVAALALVALLAALLAGGVVLRGRPHEVAPPPVVAAGVPVPGSSAAASASPAAEVVVSVGGKVARPGLVRLPAGSRVDDAVRAGGGALPGADLSALNLARKLVDGEQVLVGVPQPAGTAPGAPTADGLLDLNTATLEQFDALPGIGPVLAAKILNWRTEHDRFGSVDQLREVSGIGESKYSELKGKVRV